MYVLLVFFLNGNIWEQDFTTEAGCRLAREVSLKDPEVSTAVCQKKVDIIK